MGAFHEPLPEGWSAFEKQETFYQWRCPWGELCNKKDKVLFECEKKNTVLDSAAMHLCNEDGHEEFKDFDNARSCAIEGLTKKITKVTVYYDENGDEHKELPSPKAKKRPTPPAKSPTEGERKKQHVQSRREYYQNQNQNHKERDYRRKDTEVIGARRSKDRKGSSSRDQYDDGNRSRTSRARLRSASRTRRRSRSRGTSNRQDNQITTLVPPPTWPVIGTQSVPFQIRAGPRDHEVTIGRVELDQITDSLTRASAAANACMLRMRQFCTAAESSFRAEKDCMDTCRANLQRFSRA